MGEYSTLNTCFKTLKQITGTCYLNAVLNGLLSDKAIARIILQRINQYRTDLQFTDPEKHKRFIDETDICPLPNNIDKALTLHYSEPRYKEARFIVLKYFWSFLCKGNEIKALDKMVDIGERIGKAINQTRTKTTTQVETDGGKSLKVLLNVLKAIYEKEFYDKVFIGEMPYIVSENFEIFIYTQQSQDRSTMDEWLDAKRILDLDIDEDIDEAFFKHNESIFNEYSINIQKIKATYDKEPREITLSMINAYIDKSLESYYKDIDTINGILKDLYVPIELGICRYIITRLAKIIERYLNISGEYRHLLGTDQILKNYIKFEEPYEFEITKFNLKQGVFLKEFKDYFINTFLAKYLNKWKNPVFSKETMDNYSITELLVLLDILGEDKLFNTIYEYDKNTVLRLNTILNNMNRQKLNYKIQYNIVELFRLGKDYLNRDTVPNYRRSFVGLGVYSSKREYGHAVIGTYCSKIPYIIDSNFNYPNPSLDWLKYFNGFGYYLWERTHFEYAVYVKEQLPELSPEDRLICDPRLLEKRLAESSYYEQYLGGKKKRQTKPKKVVAKKESRKK